MASQIANLLTKDPWIGIVVFIVVFAVLVILAWWLRRRYPYEIGVEVRAPVALRTVEEEKSAARRGLIAFVSLYSPLPGSSALGLKPEEREKAIQEGNIAALDLERSNLGQTLKALRSHREKLDHCWLIGTQSQDSRFPGSDRFAPLVARYAIENGLVRPECKFHFGTKYSVVLDDDVLVFNKSMGLVRAAFREAVDLGLAPSDVVADITSGVRSMPLGMTLACLDGYRDIEILGAKYGPDGKVIPDKAFPIIFSFEPRLSEGHKS